MVGVYNMTPESQKLPRWVIPLGNWAWDALTEETPLTDGPLPWTATRCAGSCSRRDATSARETRRDRSRSAPRWPSSTWSGRNRARTVLGPLAGDPKAESPSALWRSGQHGMNVRAFVARKPDENQPASTDGCWSAISSCTASRSPGRAGRHLSDRAGAVGVTPAEVDRLLGAVAETADDSFNPIVELGFADSIRREWAWRRSRGESTANLAAFTHLDPATSPRSAQMRVRGRKQLDPVQRPAGMFDRHHGIAAMTST